MTIIKPALLLRSRRLQILFLFLVMLCMFRLKEFPLFIEKYYSQGLYPFISGVLQSVSRILPFSLGDLFYIALIVLLIVTIVRIIRDLVLKQYRKGFRSALSIILSVQVLLILFYTFWGMNYFRVPAAQRLGLQDTSYTFPELEKVTAMLIDSANHNRSLLSSNELGRQNGEIFRISAEAMGGLPQQYSAVNTALLRTKNSLFSLILNHIGTAGYYNPFTAEAQLNSEMPVYTRPFSACHEMAHQLGFNREDEANFAGFIAGRSSSDRLLRYSSYYQAMQEFLLQVGRRDSLAFKSLKNRINKPVLQDLKAEREYWEKYQGKAGLLSGILYDNYLKANNQPNGLRTYNRMILLTMALYRKNGYF